MKRKTEKPGDQNTSGQKKTLGRKRKKGGIEESLLPASRRKQEELEK